MGRSLNYGLTTNFVGSVVDVFLACEHCRQLHTPSKAEFMKFVYSKLPVGGLSLNIAETESFEPTLLMLHGVTRRWQTFLPISAQLAMRHRLVLVDFRGHGCSDHADTGYHVTNYVDDICELVERHINGPIYLYGHSLGAMTVAGVAAKLAGRISAIVMEDPPLHAMGDRISESSLLGYFSTVSKFAGNQDSVENIARQLGASVFQDPKTGQQIRIGATRDGAQLRFAASCLRRLDPAVFEPMLSGHWLDGYDVDSVFKSLTCPSLLLQADVSAGGMLSDQDAIHVTDLNPNVVRVSFGGVGHGMHWTETSRLLNTVLPFLESTR